MPDKDSVYHVVSLSFGALSDDTAFPTCDPTRSHISPSITKLPHLRTLFFFRCFTNNPQPIPAFLGQLGLSLQTLVLRENGHIGSVPVELGNLNRLRVLDLHRNSLNGSIPSSLNRMGSLKSLDLSANRLTGSIPEFSFPFLKVLDLNQNLLTGPLPSTLGTCHSLIKLDLSHNRFTGSIPDSVNGLVDLTLMDLSYNRLSGPFPGSLPDLRSLQALILKGNPMDPQATIPENGLSGMSSLTILDLSSMNLHGSIPEALAHLPSLRVLHLERNHLNGSIPRSFKNLKSLSELRLNDNLLTGPVPFEREMVWRMKNKLRLHNNVGLCFESTNGFDEVGFDDGSDVGPCDAGARSDDKRTVQHVSDNSKDFHGKVKSSSAAKVSLSDALFSRRLFILLLIFILF